jgi:hypothetical protein
VNLTITVECGEEEQEWNVVVVIDNFNDDDERG